MEGRPAGGGGTLGFAWCGRISSWPRRRKWSFPRSGLSLQSSQVTMMTPGEAERLQKTGRPFPDVAQEIALRSQRLVRVLQALVGDRWLPDLFYGRGEYPAEIASLGRGRAQGINRLPRSKNPPSGSRLRCRRADFCLFWQNSRRKKRDTGKRNKKEYISQWMKPV